jgi:hypothetical protein
VQDDGFRLPNAFLKQKVGPRGINCSSHQDTENPIPGPICGRKKQKHAGQDSECHDHSDITAKVEVTITRL